MLPNTLTPFESRCVHESTSRRIRTLRLIDSWSRGLFPWEDAVPDALERVGHGWHQFLLETHVANLAADLDPEQLVAEAARQVAQSRRQQPGDLAPVGVEDQVEVVAVQFDT